MTAWKSKYIDCKNLMGWGGTRGLRTRDISIYKILGWIFASYTCSSCSVFHSHSCNGLYNAGRSGGCAELTAFSSPPKEP